MSKPRLMIVGPLPPPPGGGETVTKLLIASSLRDSYELRHFDTTRRQTKEQMGRFTLANVIWAMRYVAGLRRALREFRPQIVHFPIASGPAMIRDNLFARAIRAQKAVSVMHNHSGQFEDDYLRATSRRQAFTRKFLGQADAIVCLSPKWKTFFDSLATGAHTEVIHNPVDPDFEMMVDSDVRQPHDGVRVLFVGAVCEPKGVPELLLALESLMETRPGLTAVIVGGRQFPGHYERIMGVHAKLANRERIYFAGPRFGKELVAEYMRADIFTLPSHSEGVPMVIIEAMAAGLPVVATSVGGIPDVLVSGVNGILVGPKRPSELANALAKLVDEPELRRRIGEQNKSEAMLKYCAEECVAACDRLYQRLLERRAS